ncbi:MULTISPECIES: PEP/pyruvate-binding domain-containing protein [unclassified Microbacterium]|uniref:PEP/pyruvate-binding domain-containing protein n=1 Tax=unclassified Microbacterium TaxID=2609290 RepID=UPI0012FB298C|nr:PEP/pyruvate-binding domain-containing protein [Microbacterium sp. MAH-37]MVQ41274.1 phosphoenolpyruvate synthase [Microbacterium sp. MAH-37]
MTEQNASLVRPLSDLRSTDVQLAGGKGANLGELLRAGFPVPDGFVVTTAAYDAFVSAAGMDAALEKLAAGADADAAQEAAALFAASDLPSDLVEQIAAAYAALDEGPVAVRSSATAEDLPGASFAGQQDTYLNIDGTAAVVHAVRRCWASLWNARAIAYRSQVGHEAAAGLSIAVVVQRLIPAEVAGVMFTANPGNGRRDETVITASWGLGESVVGGLVEPDEYTVHDDAVDRRIATKAVMTVRVDGGSEQSEVPSSQADAATLTDAQARALAAIGAGIQSHFGAPQDVEWALADGEFQIVQARPITALPEPTGEVPTDWPLPRKGSLYFRASIVEQMPDPLTPLFAGLVSDAVPFGLRSMLSGVAPDLSTLDMAFPTINGYAYYDYPQSTFIAMLKATPPLMRFLLRKGYAMDKWHDEALPAYRAVVARHADEDASQLSAADLIAGVRELLGAACAYYSIVQMVMPLAGMSEVLWTKLYDSTMRRAGDPQASDFLLGFDSAPMRSERALHELAEWCRTQPGLAESLDAGDDLPEEFQKRLDAYLAEYGHTVYNLDFINPVPADDPEPVFETLKHTIAGNAADPGERQRASAARRERITRELIARLDPVRRELAERRLRSAQLWAPVREDALAAMGLAWPVQRRLLRELGARLAASGALESVEDVFWITAAEADADAAALDSGAALPDHRADVDERHRTWRGRRLATPPQYLPKGGWMTSMERFMPARESDETGPVLHGTGGSGGQVTAPARVLGGTADFASFQPGEVLVASITTPAYTPLFALASGVVTDIGGVLSHGSIVAREYGIPAVLGTGSATKRISTGDVLTVNGATGTVRLDGAPDQAADAAVEPKRGKVLAILLGVAAAAGVVLLIARRRRH